MAWSCRYGRLRCLLVCLVVIFGLVQHQLILLLPKDIQQQRPTHLVQQEISICQKLLKGREASTAASFWLSFESQILEALVHPQDTEHLQKPWIEELLRFLTPFKLKKAMLPHTDPNILKSLLRKLQTRLHDPSKYPKIKVLVFGGSIVEGSGCDIPPPAYVFRKNLDTSSSNSRTRKLAYNSLQECAWPHRLQLLADAVFPNSIDIFNLAVGGTHSRAAVPVLEHWLLPSDIIQKQPNGPDIIINAYAANDNLPPAYHNTQNTTKDYFHKYRVWKRLLEFVSAAKASRTRTECHTREPWIIFLHDYLGNQQESLVGESTVDEVVQWLVTTTTNSPISYVRPAHLLSPYVWANASEHVWSGDWKNKKEGGSGSKINVHYGTAGHVTTAITVAYAMLQWGMDFCQEEEEREDLICRNDDSSTSFDYPPLFPDDNSNMVQIELPSKEWMKVHQPDRVVPNITERERNYKKRSAVASPNNKNCPSTTRQQHDCVFAFLAAPLGTHSKKGPLQSYINDYTLSSKDWMVQNNFRQGGFQNKLGLVATQPSAMLHFKFPVVAGTATSNNYYKLTIHYLKSYGDEWKNSHLKGLIEVYNNKTPTGTKIVFELDGYHDQAVSISYTYVADDIVVDDSANSSIHLTLELVSGTTFKINAMMLCNSAG
eukprot:scaffold19531_cov106-Cylindrotheca_fusiformis.AAC.3